MECHSLTYRYFHDGGKTHNLHTSEVMEKDLQKYEQQFGTRSCVDNSYKNFDDKRKLFTGVKDMTIITPSNWLAGLVKKSFLSEYPVKIIRNGIDTSKFFRIKSDFRKIHGLENKFLILGVSTAWDEMKGLGDYIKLADILGTDYKIILVGLTKKQKENLPEKIFGIERTNSVEELVKIYSTADLYANLSYCENYPGTNLEAAACGTPVLTYNSGGSPESALNGIIIPRGDINKTAEKIKNFRENPDSINMNNINRSEIDTKKTLDEYMKFYLI